jgi:hypothetical protein
LPVVGREDQVSASRSLPLLFHETGARRRKTHLLKLSCPAAVLSDEASAVEGGEVDGWFGDVEPPGGVESISIDAMTPARALLAAC